MSADQPSRQLHDKQEHHIMHACSTRLVWPGLMKADLVCNIRLHQIAIIIIIIINIIIIIIIKSPYNRL
jgi:hypothetical protein